jgi:hypothetical protein
MNALVKFALSVLVILMMFAIVGLSYIVHVIDVEMIKHESSIESANSLASVSMR